MKKIWLLSILFLVSCASMRDSNQSVKLSTSPKRGDLYFGETSLGSAPVLAQLERGFFNGIKVKNCGKDSWRFLKKSYRWEDSFFANMIFLVGAPVGWIVDLYTGSAWEYDSLQEFSCGEGDVELLPENEMVVAVAPPKVSNELLSDEIAIEIEKVLMKKYPKGKVLPYRYTEKIFIDYGEDFQTKVSNKYEVRLENDLHANHIARSSILTSSDPIDIETHVDSIFSKNSRDIIKTSFLPTEFKYYNPDFADSIFSNITLIPNSISLELVAKSLSVNIESGGNSYQSENSGRSGILRHVTGINFTNIKGPKLSEHYEWYFRTSPDFGYSNRVEKFRGLPGLTDTTFNWHRYSLGYGAEFGLESPFGRPYFSSGIAFAYNSIKWNDKKSSHSDWAICPRFEVGHGFFLANRYHLKLFVRLNRYKDSIWEEVLEKSAGLKSESDIEGELTTGLLIHFYLPEVRLGIKRLLL